MTKELRRRAGFWRNLEYNLDVLHEEIIARSAEKWLDDDDRDTLSCLSSITQGILAVARARLADVLMDQAKEVMG